MKKLITIFIGLVTYNLAQGQISWGDYSQSYLREVIKQKNGIGVIAAIRMENNSFWVDNVNGKLMKSLSVDSVFMHSRHKDFIAINSFDSASAHFFCYGIDPGNAIDFEYRVLKNDKEMLMDWSPIKEFTADSVQELSGMPEMAYLGAFKVPVGSFEVVDIRNRISGKIVATGVVAWQKIKPLISDIYTSNELNAFITRLSRPWKYNRQTMTIDKWRKRYQVDQLDSATGLPRKLYLEHNENNLIFFLNADIYKESQVEYQLSEGQKVVRSWGINEFDNSIVWLNNLSPGSYRLEIRYVAQQENVTGFYFEISKAWYQTILFKAISTVLMVAFIGFIVLSIIVVKQRQKTLSEETRKALLQLEIKAIHAQFNPHFVFNALNSIQGLINKEDIKGANKYLSVFGQLMRNSLANSDKNLITLSEEIGILETYLQLEQLRFGFIYRINVSPEINKYEVEVPSLLLQPLLENSIKHGIAGLRSDGIIELLFERENNDLLIRLSDNGRGFDPKVETKGYGLKLTKDRINLMNRILEGQSIQMDMVSTPGFATNTIISFRNWFT